MNIRNIFFWVHLVTGVVAGSIIFIMSVTGTMLAFEPQIVKFAERNIRRVNQAEGAGRMPLNKISEAVKRERPGDSPSFLLINSEPESSVVVSFGKGKGALYINPFTGELLGKGSKTDEVMHFIEDIHRWLGSRKIGRPITGACAVAFLIMIVTGLVLWWPQSWNLKGIRNILMFNPKAQGQARDWNWHNVIGFWLAPVLIITTLTGIVMSYKWANDLVYRMAGSQPPPPREAPKEPVKKEKDKDKPEGKIERPKYAGGQADYDLDMIVSLAKQKVPGWTSMRIRFPRGGKGNISVSVEEPVAWHPSPRSTLTVDPKTGKEVSWEPYTEMDRGRKWRSWVKEIHTGQAFGLIGQSVMFIGACGAAVLVWTGLSMSWRRFFGKKKGQAS